MGFQQRPSLTSLLFSPGKAVVRSALSSDTVKIIEQYLERQDDVAFAKRSLNMHNKILCVKVWCVQGVEITGG